MSKLVELDPICKCGCNRKIQVKEFRTHEGEWVYEESCFMRIAYSEGWIQKSKLIRPPLR
ncbi:hypothetical protein OMP38_14670 [Cohnella ginsengisoli]|uniref:Uncharacterized protein n=1 Tax=Cohnella ginsengisoli TaxID=425004 RepID=A0A9X4QNV2_9BACL|nr:hypothetical protein [Cohnella ginsengisoli]MDG0791960.1 hypothetical protein [Cohnella ginsengisoli]